MDSIPPLKRCSKCGVEFPATTEHFQVCKQQKSGFRPRCKTCDNDAARARYQSEDVKARKSEYRQRSDVLERERIYHNSDKAKATRKLYDARPDIKDRNRLRDKERNKDPKRREQSLLSDRKRRSKPSRKITVRVYEARRRAIERSLPSDFTREDWYKALDYFNGCCAVCGNQLHDLFGNITAQADHWIPITSPNCPGTVVTNMLPLCGGLGGCNNRKNNREPEQWLVSRYGKQKAKEIIGRIKAYFEWVEQQ